MAEQPKRPYVHQHYPKTLYHPELAPVTVNTPEQHEALGEEWAESPADFADFEKDVPELTAAAQDWEESDDDVPDPASEQSSSAKE